MSAQIFLWACCACSRDLIYVAGNAFLLEMLWSLHLPGSSWWRTQWYVAKEKGDNKCEAELRWNLIVILGLWGRLVVSWNVYKIDFQNCSVSKCLSHCYYGWWVSPAQNSDSLVDQKLKFVSMVMSSITSKFKIYVTTFVHLDFFREFNFILESFFFYKNQLSFIHN